MVNFVATNEDDGQIRAVDGANLDRCPTKAETLIRAEEKNCPNLPLEILFLIFKKMTPFCIIGSAQFVCRTWMSLSHDPELWKRIDMTWHPDFLTFFNAKPIAMEAVDRSRGRLEEFYAENFGDDDLMRCIADRTTRLRCLRLLSTYFISDEALLQAVHGHSQLEELEISYCSFSSEVVMLLCQACPQLKCFKFFQRWDILWLSESEKDKQALAIAGHMRQLHQLELHGNTISAMGLVAILDNCPYLQHLVLLKCPNLHLDENLKKRCVSIREFRFRECLVD